MLPKDKMSNTLTKIRDYVVDATKEVPGVNVRVLSAGEAIYLDLLIDHKPTLEEGKLIGQVFSTVNAAVIEKGEYQLKAEVFIGEKHPVLIKKDF